MVDNNKKYLIDGWCIVTMLDIIRVLKSQVQVDYKKFTKEDFVRILGGYDRVISYLLELKPINLNESVDMTEGMGVHEKYVRNMLNELNIPIENGDTNETKNQEDSEEEDEANDW